MPDMLALDWESHQLCGLDADVSKGKVQIRQGFVWDWPEDVNPHEQPQRAGEWLKSELRDAKVTAEQVLVSLPREDVVVRTLELPAAPDDELPDMVRLQAATASSTPLDRLLLDFLPLPGLSEAGGRSVLLATIAKSAAERIRTAVQAAGLQLASIGISPLGAAELVARQERLRELDSEESSLALARHGNRVEISLLRARSLLFTHSTELFGEDEQEDIQRLLAEISRSQIALQQLLAGRPLARAWVFGRPDENTRLREALAKRLKCQVAPLDPLADDGLVLPRHDLPGSHALYAGPAGLLLAEAGRLTPPLDFLNPRKPPVKQDRRKLKIVAAAAGMLLLTGVAWGSAKLKQFELDDDISKATTHSLDLDNVIKRGKPILDSAALVDDWTAQNVGWLQQIQDLNKLLPGTARLYLSDYRFNPATGDAVARIQATGYARERRDVDDLGQRLVNAGYRVLPPQSTANLKDPEYPYRFDLDLQIPKQSQPPPNPQ